MKALVYTGVKNLEYKDVPDPVLSEGDNLIVIRSVGLCGSDMHAYLGHDERRPAPLILGHEAAGDVIEGPLKGKRVTVNPLVTCQRCEACLTGRTNLCANRQIISMQPREGAFAEQVAMPSRNLVEIPNHISYDHAAMAEPLAVCWHAIRLGEESLHTDLDTAKCLVIGGGAIGLGSALSLKAKGATDITISEPNEIRRNVLNDLNCFATYDPSNGHNVSSHYDVVVDAVGFSGSRADACMLAKPGGVILHIGLGDSKEGLDIRRLTLQEIMFIGTYTYTEDDFRETAQAIYAQKFGALNWMENRALKDGNQAFTDILAGNVAAPKIILNP
ncbi:alcohol dehydrogenase catalytic domain-containing protein [Amylibacter sp. SFDW26]|uniref:alcohol dehydrogenase catalytic domain-containing protein n=1 Tax=Amylibacter sp. SFDW26 TaxID=2652722 RepID=UPI0012618D0D|nr:alcohol dehydrogenase catalytic domain-containing protein [Amylibacter sp. SFDW26]KAB7610051.1 alcohol dehydrogenase catalytic domain-containing protein [Amylibacter sp. SFDW26]